MGLFGKSHEKNPKEMVKSIKKSNRNNVKKKNIHLLQDFFFFFIFKVNEWAQKLRKEGYQIDRQVRGESQKHFVV